jgi:hypothetical protein
MLSFVTRTVIIGASAVFVWLVGMSMGFTPEINRELVFIVTGFVWVVMWLAGQGARADKTHKRQLRQDDPEDSDYAASVEATRLAQAMDAERDK